MGVPESESVPESVSLRVGACRGMTVDVPVRMPRGTGNTHVDVAGGEVCHRGWQARYVRTGPDMRAHGPLQPEAGRLSHNHSRKGFLGGGISAGTMGMGAISLRFLPWSLAA